MYYWSFAPSLSTRRSSSARGGAASVSFRSASRRAPVSSKLMPGPELVASFQEPGGEEEPGRDREAEADCAGAAGAGGEPVEQKKKKRGNNRRTGKRKPAGIELADLPNAAFGAPEQQRLSAAGSLEDSGQRTAGPVADVGTAAAADDTVASVHDDVRSWNVEQVRAFLQWCNFPTEVTPEIS